MKLALTVWDDRISPVADSARRLLVVRVRSQGIMGRELAEFDSDSIFYRARRLADLDTRILICGAISDFFAGLVKGYGIRLIPRIRGQVEEVVDAFLGETLTDPKFAMIGSLRGGLTRDEAEER